MTEGTGRVRLRFAPADREVRVPPGVSVFEAASWNGIAIDSTCGGHGTCHKCRIRIEGADGIPITRHDVKTFTPDQIQDGWRLACLVPAARAHVQPQLTDPEHGWREADRAVDAAVGRFGPGAVQRAVLARRGGTAHATSGVPPANDRTAFGRPGRHLD